VNQQQSWINSICLVSAVLTEWQISITGFIYSSINTGFIYYQYRLHIPSIQASYTINTGFIYISINTGFIYYQYRLHVLSINTGFIYYQHRLHILSTQASFNYLLIRVTKTKEGKGGSSGPPLPPPRLQVECVPGYSSRGQISGERLLCACR
jgi:hypothetical protein